MDIVLFEEAILSLVKINRVLCNPKGNLMLLGEGGTGRHSLSKLSAFINDMQLFDKKQATEKQAVFRGEMKTIFENIVGKD